MRKISILFIVALLVGCSAVGPKLPGAQVGATYIVRKGDTLDKIGTKFFIPAGELAQYNHINDARKLRVGQVLKIPSVGPLQTQGLQTQGLQTVPFDSAMGIKPGQQQVSLANVRGYIGGLIVPVEDSVYTSKFGWRWNRFHEGVDLAADYGSKVYAAHSGRVVYTSESHSGYGRIVVLQSEGLMTVYGHNSENRVSVGDVVNRGDWIADVGQSGRASGPHLHFETRVKGSDGLFAAVDPIVFLRPSGWGQQPES